MPLLIRVEMPSFVAGCVARGQRITARTAPILFWWVGQTPQALARWVRENGGSISVVTRFKEKGPR